MVFTTVRDAKGQLQVRGKASALAPNSEQNFLVQISWPGHVRLQQVSVSLPAAGIACQQRRVASGRAGDSDTELWRIPVRLSVEKSTIAVSKPVHSIVTLSARDNDSMP